MSIGNLADELNAVIRCIESEFEKLGVPGGTGEIKYSHGVFRLGFGKIDGEWKLIVNFPAGTSVPLLNASIEIRCAAMHHLDALRQEMWLASQEQTSMVETAITLGRSFYRKFKEGAK